MESGLQIPWSTVVIAKYLGQALTSDVAKSIALEIEHGPDASIDPSRFEPLIYGPLVFRAERFRDIEEEMHRLHVLHWQETEAHRHGIPMDPNYRAFKVAEAAGRLVQFTARDVHGVLAGNIRMYLFTNQHTNTLAAKEDTFFILPEHRKGFTAVRFWQYMERCLEHIGVIEITTDSKVINNVGQLSKYMGYKHIANTYHRLLIKPDGVPCDLTMCQADESTRKSATT